MAEKKLSGAGLRGQSAGDTRLCTVGKSGSGLTYCGYDIAELAENAKFEEVAYLLIFGELPNTEELSDFDARLKAARHLPQEIYQIIEATKSGHPMDVLRTATSALAALEPQSLQLGEEAFIENGIRLTSQLPMIIAAHETLRNGRTLVSPDPNLSHAANWLWMLKGEVPSADAARLADVDFILHAEHGSNASSFAARVTIGTEANLHGAVVTALATLAGPAHGGAAEDVMKMVMEIGTPDKAADYVKAKRAAREPVTGFGHRVYRAEDPRARHMREGVRKLGQEMGAPEWYEILQGVVDAMKPYARHGLNVNVDFYSGVVYQLHGIPMDLYVPIFAIGRMPGWIIQCLEQQRGNILIRPLTLYNGPEMRPFKTLKMR